ncbi:MAG: PAAR domain-containing protein [Clostridiales bacterium]|nr:PAAR domain-containing protein [Clostridiales bacterium]
MGSPAAKKGDLIVAIDTHTVIVEEVPTPGPHPFNGVIDGGLCGSVLIMGAAAATVDSTATNTPPHLPIPSAGKFADTPSDKATISAGSGSVFIGGKPAARSGDTADTCNDGGDLPVGSVVAAGSVFIG